MPVEMDRDDMTEADADAATLKKETDRAREKRTADAYKNTLSTPEGRCVLYSILETAGMFRQVWAGDMTLVTTGAHDVASGLWGTLIAISPSLVATMIKENAR